MQLPLLEFEKVMKVLIMMSSIVTTRSWRASLQPRSPGVQSEPRRRISDVSEARDLLTPELDAAKGRREADE